MALTMFEGIKPFNFDRFDDARFFVFVQMKVFLNFHTGNCIIKLKMDNNMKIQFL